MDVVSTIIRSDIDTFDETMRLKMESNNPANEEAESESSEY